MKKSVCMATYNGAKYIEEQVSSILTELDVEDEVVIVDDKSSDNTVELIRRMADDRIKIYENEVNHGPNEAFGKAISLSKGDIIFMSDQDDIWIRGRTHVMTNALMSENVIMVSSNFDCFDNMSMPCKIHDSKLESKKSKKYCRNIIDIFWGNLNYYGCAMVFKKELIPVILPFPSYIESHDLWIAKAANLMKSNIHINDLTLHRRIHGNNASILKRKLWKKIWSRIVFVVSIFTLLKRIVLNNGNN